MLQFNDRRINKDTLKPGGRGQFSGTVKEPLPSNFNNLVGHLPTFLQFVESDERRVLEQIALSRTQQRVIGAIDVRTSLLRVYELLSPQLRARESAAAIMAITYGTIGSGWITDSWISAARKSGKWQLHAIYSRKQNQAEAFGSKHGCTKLYTSLEQFVKDDGMQVVYIASPNSLHYEQAKLVLTAGKHVILEKPATSTVSELENLFQIAKEQNVFLIEAYRHLQEANFKLLRRLVKDESTLGPIYGASLTYASFSSRYNNVLAGEVPNIFSLDFAGGSLVDIGVYPVSLAVALFGRPESQVYVPFICKTGVDGGGVMILRYEKFGVQINNSKSYTSTAPCEIYGEKGTLRINGTTDITTLSHWDPQSKETKELAGTYLTVDKPNVNMQEEATEFARIIEQRDHAAVAELEEISKIVMEVTQNLRRQNGILYPADAAT